MPFDAGAVLDKLAEIAAATTGVGAVYVGVPEAPQDRLVATVSLAGATVVVLRRMSTVRRQLRYRVEFAYRVAADEAAAERAVCAALDDFLTRIYADMTLVQACNSADQIDLSQADAPEYRTVAGLETRVYPIVIGATQEAPFNPSP